MTSDEPDAPDDPDEPEVPSPNDISDLRGLLKSVQRLVDPRAAVQAAAGQAGAAWRSATREEPRVQVTIAVIVAIGLMLTLPSRVANHPLWVVPSLSAMLLVGVFVAKSSSHSDRRSRILRVVSLALIGVMTLSNAISAGRLIVDLVTVQGVRQPARLLLTGGAIWFTNVIVFALWYWEFDRGGLVQRAAGVHAYPDLLFPQMTSPELAPPDWEPGFIDYLYVSFTNATAFSPTDVLPMTQWAKLTMLTQSAISVMTVALVIARAVNILG
ncbi:MAG TPA: hypothetical protein VGP92_15140 [Acidimicrobiia bacterium]|nr:hypothetical protein [Acidimicrobiia bacterium]